MWFNLSSNLGGTCSVILGLLALMGEKFSTKVLVGKGFDKVRYLNLDILDEQD